MHVAVILRLNPVLTDELELTDAGTDIDRQWIGLELNPFDDQALEQAALLKETVGAKVTAVAVEAEGGERLLKSALARGADAVVLVPIEGGEHARSPSSRARTPLLVEVLRSLSPDLVLTGVLSTDDLYGELAPQLGAALDWPQASAVSEARVQGGIVTVRQEYSGGVSAYIEMNLPAVVGLQTAPRPPRFVSGGKLRDLLKVDVPQLKVEAALAVDLSESTVLELPDTGGGAEMIEGDADAIAGRIIEILKDRGLA